MGSRLLMYTFFVLLTFTTMPAFLVGAYAKDMKMQESSYAPVMITKSFEAVREQDLAEKPEVMSKHMAMLRAWEKEVVFNSYINE